MVLIFENALSQSRPYSQELWESSPGFLHSSNMYCKDGKLTPVVNWLIYIRHSPINQCFLAYFRFTAFSGNTYGLVG